MQSAKEPQAKPTLRRHHLLLSNTVLQIGLICLAVILGNLTAIRWWQFEFSLLSLVIGVLIGILAASGIFQVAKSSLPIFGQLPGELRKVLDVFIPVRRTMDLLLLSVMAGVGEEAIFRGFFQPWIASMLPTPVAILCSAALFGLMHFISFSYCIYIFSLGIVFGIITHFTGGPWAAMIAHAVFDFVGLWLGMNYLAGEQRTGINHPSTLKNA